MYGDGQFLPVFIQTSAIVAEFTELYLRYFKLKGQHHLLVSL